LINRINYLLNFIDINNKKETFINKLLINNNKNRVITNKNNEINDIINKAFNINYNELKYLLNKLNTLLKKIYLIINLIKLNNFILKEKKHITNNNTKLINNKKDNKLINNKKDNKLINDKLLNEFDSISYQLIDNNKELNNKNIYLNILNYNINNITNITNINNINNINNMNNITNRNNKNNITNITNKNIKKINPIINNFINKDFYYKENIIKVRNNIIKTTISLNDILINNINIINMSNSNIIKNLIPKGIITKSKVFNKEINTISLNSNPVNVLYFNDNKNKPMLNQYIKNMSIYNLNRKGSFMFYSSIIGYKFYRKFRPFLGYTGLLKSSNIYKLIYSSFKSMYCLISKPVVIIKSNKIIIQLFYYLLVPRIFKYKKKFSALKRRRGYVLYYNYFNQKLIRKFKQISNFKKKLALIKLDRINLVNLYPEKLKNLCEILNNFFKKSVEFNLIRLHYPYKDTNILARLLAFMINKIKIRRMTRNLLKKIVIRNINKNLKIKNKTHLIPAFLSGLTIKIGGRIMKYKIIPRKTVKIIRRGSSSVGKINYKNFARFTNKNKRGAFSISILSGQNFF
jgi:hypothetical protein